MTGAATLSGTAEVAERDQIVEVARELGTRELGPRALELDERREGALEAAWEKVTAVGFDRALVGVEDGGAELDRGSLLTCLEEIAAGDAGVAMLILLSNAAFVALPGELLADVAGDERWALVPAPPEELPTAARVHAGGKDDGTFDGELCPALGALGATGLVVVTREPHAAVLPIELDGAGIRVEASEPQLGLRAAASARISLSGVQVGCPLPPDRAEVAAARSLDLLRAGTAAIARGVARRAQRLAHEYALDRIQGGVPIVEHDAVRDMLAAMAVRIAGVPGADRGTGRCEALAAKVAATEAAVETATDAVQVFGGTGYMHETGVEKLMRDAKHLQLWPAPNWIARDLLMGASQPRA
jgi:alkylation response protein AidB-like acyl-CoA dehydrogenase